MKRGKRLLAVMLSLTMVFSMVAFLSACSGTKTVTMAFIGCTVSDDKAVVDAVNERLKELGLKFKFRGIWDDWGGARSLQSLDTGNSDIDITFAASWAVNYGIYAPRGTFIRLDDPKNNYLQKYPGLVAAVPSGLWNTFRIDGGNGFGLYAVPGYKDYSVQYSWMINNTKLKELGFDYDSFVWSKETIFDPQFDAACAKAKEVYGASFYPIVPEISNFFRHMLSTDGDPSRVGVLHLGFDPNDPSKPERSYVKYIFDMPEAKAVLAKLEEFNQKGYIDPRASISGEAADAQSGAWDTGNYLFSTRWADRSYAKTYSGMTGLDMRIPPLHRAFISTSSAMGSGFGVSVYSKNQDEAVQFLNALYTDAKLATTIAFGVEGIHHIKNSNGTVTLTERRRNEYVVWPRGVGNFMILPPTEEDGPDFVREFKAIQDEGISTGFNGFIVDAKPFEIEYAALLSVVSEYNPVITTGAGNAAMYEEFKEKLYANGLQKVIDEVNKQLEAFYNSK